MRFPLDDLDLSPYLASQSELDTSANGQAGLANGSIEAEGAGSSSQYRYDNMPVRVRVRARVRVYRKLEPVQV